MGKVYDAIEPRLREFLLAQPVFFVATAPTGSDGHVNISPKGMRGCFAVLGERRVAYLDYTGSGAETIAHLGDNGRITLMFCAFDEAPKIVRLYGRGEVTQPPAPRFTDLRPAFAAPADHGVRSIIEVEVERISDSCGFAVPLMEFVADRDLLLQWASRRSEADLAAYRAEKNVTSIDGLPAMAGGLGSDHDRQSTVEAR